MKTEMWQIRLFHKSLKKKQKLGILKRIFDISEGMVCLDLGCARGTLSFFLRKMGGMWVSADLDMSNLAVTIELVEKSVIRVEPYRLPFKDASFDAVVSFDFLEHVEKDKISLREMSRILKSGGTIYISTPVGGTFFLNWLKKSVGLTPDTFGHVREGYSLEELRNMLAGQGFQTLFSQVYSGFFTELIETGINFLFLLKSRKKKVKKRDGFITPATGEEFRAHEKSFRIYSLIYPFVLAISRLDRFFPCGYATVVKAKKFL